MALDTGIKRYSAINVSCPWRGILPFPDSTISATDRQVIAFLGSSITAGGGAPEEATGGRTLRLSPGVTLT
jgi:hypothetical protein